MEFGISLGSNLGDRLGHLREARRRVAALPGVTVLGSSAAYETEPVDVGAAHRDKPFVNAVVVVDAAAVPEVIAAELRQIEDALGRERTEDRNAPRPIDLDLIYAGSVSQRNAELTLPHPRWDQRRFVVQPLADVRPDLVLPGQRRSVREILFTLPKKPDVVLLTRVW